MKSETGKRCFAACQKWHVAKMIRAAILACIILIAPLIKSAEIVIAASPTMIHFLCVCPDNGGEDVILLESDGRFGFIDCGSWTDREQIKDAMAELGVTRENLDFVIGTHAHADHIGFLNDLMREYDIERIYLMPFTAECLAEPSEWSDTSWNNAMMTADRLKIPVIDTFDVNGSEEPWLSINESNRYTASPHFTFGDTDIEIYNYSQEYLHEKVLNANDTSLAVKITAYGHTALITGDISNAPGLGTDPGYDESRLAAAVGHVDILKLPHHGYSWYNTNLPEDLQQFSASYIIQTGPTNLLDYDCGGSNTFEEIRHECEKGAFYLSTAWYNPRIMKNDDAINAISIDMNDLSSNIPKDYCIAAVDKSNALYLFRGGQITNDAVSGNKTYLSTGSGFSDSVALVRIGDKLLAVNKNGRILSNTVEVNGALYTCDPDHGECRLITSEKEPPEIEDPFELRPQEDSIIEGAYFADWDRKEMLNALNQVRRDAGVEELRLVTDHTYADVRAIEYARNPEATTLDVGKDEVIIPCFGSLSADTAIERTIKSDEYKKKYLNKSYRYISCSCFIKPMDIGFATIYAIEFYDENYINTDDGNERLPDQSIEETNECPVENEYPEERLSDAEYGEEEPERDNYEALLKENNELLRQIIKKLEELIKILQTM